MDKSIYKFMRRNGYPAKWSLDCARADTENLRIRWENETMPVEDCIDLDLFPKLLGELESGKMLHLCALVEKRCQCCDNWEIIDSLGSVLAYDGDDYFQCIEYELMAENTQS